MNSIRRSFCVSSLISYGRSGGNIFNGGGGGGSFLSISVFLLLSFWWGSLVLILFIWLFQERFEREKGRKTGGQKAGRRFRLHSHFKSLFPFFEQKKIIKIIISLLILSSIMVIQWHPNPDCLFMFDHIRTCSLNWCWRRKWLLDKENVLSALYLAFQRCRQFVNKSWIDNDEKKRNPFEMIYNARMFHWRRGTLTARHYNLSSDNDDDDDDNGDDEMRRWHHTGAEWRGKKSQWTGKKTTAVHARAYNTIVAVVVKLR